MAGIADLGNIVGAQALLHVRDACTSRVWLAQQERHQRVHAGGGEQHTWVVLGDQRRAADNRVVVGAQVIEKGLT
jgi:hypothetical protein